jgi:hypothetical protein
MNTEKTERIRDERIRKHFRQNMPKEAHTKEELGRDGMSM